MAVIDENTPFIVETESGEVLLVADPEQMIIEAIESTTLVAAEKSLGIITEERNDIVLQPENQPVVIEAQETRLTIEAGAVQGPVGPQGAQGPAGIPGISIPFVQIPAGSTFQIDFVLVDNIEAIQWQLVARVPTGEVRGVTAYVTWDAAGNTYRVVYAQTGGGFARFEIGTTLITGIGNNVQLAMKNNHTDDLVVTGTRFEIGSAV